MALLTPTAVPGSAATAITFASVAAGGDTVAYKKDKLQIILFRKTGGASADVTIAAARSTAQAGRDVATLSSLTFAMVSSNVKAVLVTPAYVGSDGLVAITYTAIANLSVCVLEI